MDDARAHALMAAANKALDDDAALRAWMAEQGLPPLKSQIAPQLAETYARAVAHKEPR